MFFPLQRHRRKQDSGRRNLEDPGAPDKKNSPGGVRFNWTMTEPEVVSGGQQRTDVGETFPSDPGAQPTQGPSCTAPTVPVAAASTLREPRPPPPVTAKAGRDNFHLPHRTPNNWRRGPPQPGKAMGSPGSLPVMGGHP